jgi:hypothetical protein
MSDEQVNASIFYDLRRNFGTDKSAQFGLPMAATSE